MVKGLGVGVNMANAVRGIIYIANIIIYIVKCPFCWEGGTPPPHPTNIPHAG